MDEVEGLVDRLIKARESLARQEEGEASMVCARVQGGLAVDLADVARAADGRKELERIVKRIEGRLEKGDKQ